jgi:hypothetical protein
MQSDDVFCDMINSIQFLNMSKTGSDDGANTGYADSGFNSGAEMNADNIFFYEDSCPTLTSLTGKFERDEEEARGQSEPPPHQSNRRKRHNESELTQIQVNVGIDEDLKMILEMDPSLMDGESIEKAVEPRSHVVDGPKVLGLPPKG